MACAGCQVTSEMALLVSAEKGTLFCLVEGLLQERSGAATLGAPGCNLYTSWALTQEPAGSASFLLLGQRLHKQLHLQQPRSGCVQQVMATVLTSSDSPGCGTGLAWNAWTVR